MVINPTADDVARRAYELYIARGGQDGRDLEDWLEAERQLMNEGRLPHTTLRTGAGTRRRQR